MSYLQAPVCEYVLKNKLFVLPYYKRRKGGGAQHKYLPIACLEKEGKRQSKMWGQPCRHTHRFLFYPAGWVEFPDAVVVDGVVEEAFTDPCSGVPACGTVFSRAAGISMNGVAPSAPAVTRGRTPSHL